MNNASDQRIAIDPSGNITAVWVEDGFVKASFCPIGERWGDVFAFSGSGSSSPEVKVDLGIDTVIDHNATQDAAVIYRVASVGSGSILSAIYKLLFLN